MPRPCCLRHVEHTPRTVYFKPAGIPVHMLEDVLLASDELEALRLADLNGLYQEQAAEQMKISRPTFSRIVEEARRKVADALIHGKALRIGQPEAALMAEEPQDAKTARRSKGRCRGRDYGG